MNAALSHPALSLLLSLFLSDHSFDHTLVGRVGGRRHLYRPEPPPSEGPSQLPLVDLRRRLPAQADRASRVRGTRAVPLTFLSGPLFWHLSHPAALSLTSPDSPSSALPRTTAAATSAPLTSLRTPLLLTSPPHLATPLSHSAAHRNCIKIATLPSALPSPCHRPAVALLSPCPHPTLALPSLHLYYTSLSLGCAQDLHQDRPRLQPLHECRVQPHAPRLRRAAHAAAASLPLPQGSRHHHVLQHGCDRKRARRRRQAHDAQGGGERRERTAREAKQQLCIEPRLPLRQTTDLCHHIA